MNCTSCTNWNHRKNPWPTISYPRPSPVRHHLFPSSLAASSLHRQHLPLDLLRIGILLLLRPANVLVSSAVASSSSGARATEELELLLSLLSSSPNWFLQIWTLDPSCCQLPVENVLLPLDALRRCSPCASLPAADSLLLLCCSSACGVCWQTGIRWRRSKLVISWSSVPLLWITKT